MEWVKAQMHGNAMRDAAELMAWRGYEKVHAWELARAAHVSVGTLYRQYGSKRNFALEVRRFTEEELCSHARYQYWLTHSEPGQDYRAAFLVFWRALAQVVRNQPGLFCFTFVHWHPEDLGTEARGGKARALVREVLLDGEKEGALAPGSADVGETLVWGALTELARTVAQGTVEVTDEAVLASGEALWRALVPHEEPGPPGASGFPRSSGGCTAAPEVEHTEAQVAVQCLAGEAVAPAAEHVEAPRADSSLGGEVAARAVEHVELPMAGSSLAGEVATPEAEHTEVPVAAPFRAWAPVPEGRSGRARRARQHRGAPSTRQQSWHCGWAPGGAPPARSGIEAGPRMCRAGLTRADASLSRGARGPRGKARGEPLLGRHLSGAPCSNASPVVCFRSSWRGVTCRVVGGARAPARWCCPAGRRSWRWRRVEDEDAASIRYAAQPHHDQGTPKLYWTRELAFSGACAHTPFQPGHRYEDIALATGRMATYGVAGLVVAKAGFFKGLLVILAAGRKAVVAGVALLVAAVGRLFKRGGNGGEGGMP